MKSGCAKKKVHFNVYSLQQWEELLQECGQQLLMVLKEKSQECGQQLLSILGKIFHRDKYAERVIGLGHIGSS